MADMKYNIDMNHSTGMDYNTNMKYNTAMNHNTDMDYRNDMKYNTNIDYNADLEYLYTALQKHPSLYADQQKKACFERLYADKKHGKYDYDGFIDAATELTAFFHDGHTNIEIPYTSLDRCLPLQCRWAGTGNGSDLLLAQPYNAVPAGSKIISIEGMPTERIVRILSARIPHENIFLVKSRMILYPYVNYHVFSEMNLRLLFGEKDDYAVSFSVNGKIITKALPLSYYDGFLDFPEDENFLSCEILNKTAVMHLNSCICSPTYLSALKKLARLCGERQISTFLLDLSQNMGGSSAVIDEFIKFTHVKSFRRYEMIDFSSGEPKRITSRQDIVVNQQEDILLPERIYCKVSHHTFSSARTFAVTLKDNNIAEIIGSETGGKPNSYGMPLKMKMPLSNIRFRVSRCYFMRPDPDRDDEITLTPDMDALPAEEADIL